MPDKEYVCAYKYCLHPGEKVNALESVDVGKKHYHWDCAALRQQIEECVALYASYIEDKKQCLIARRAINTLVFKNKIPVEFILDNIAKTKLYYKDKPAHVLYGMKKLFYEVELKKSTGWRVIDC